MSQAPDTQSHPDQPDITDEDIRATEKAVAETVLKSEQSWEILNAMFTRIAQRIMSTQGFMFPVLNNLAMIDERLNDPVAFKKSMDTVIQDLRHVQGRLAVLKEKHRDRSGEPTPQEWPFVFSVSQEYSNLEYHFESVISPLILSLVEILQVECPELVQSPTTTDAE